MDMAERIERIKKRVVVDRYTRPKYAGTGDIWRPSDHRPILVDFDL